MAEQRPEIGRRERRIGHTITSLVAHAPWLWPLLRGPVRRTFDGMAGRWDQRESAGSAEYLTPLATAVLHVKPAPERALDIGCGTGDGTLFLAREFPRASVRGIDISTEMIDVAQGKIGLDPQGRVAFKVADASDLPFEDDSFDLVAQLNMPPFFAEMARVLRPGGYAVVTSSWGDETPFYTPAAVLQRGFEKRGMQTVDSGDAGAGTYYVARRPSA